MYSLKFLFIQRCQIGNVIYVEAVACHFPFPKFSLTVELFLVDPYFRLLRHKFPNHLLVTQGSGSPPNTQIQRLQSFSEPM
jgi:hypothetical protein